MTPRNIIDILLISIGGGGWLIDALSPTAAAVAIILGSIRIWQELFGKRR